MPCRDSSKHPKFTQQCRDKILDWLSRNHYRKVAVAAAGISPFCLFNWLKIGKEDLEHCEKEGLPLNDFAQFFLDINTTEAIAEDKALRIVSDSADPADVRWLMERRWPKRWGKMATRVELTGHGGGPIEVNVSDARKSFAKTLTAALERAGAAPPDPESGPGAGTEGGPPSPAEPA